MSQTISFFLSFLLLLLAAIQGSHALEFIVINNATSTPGGARFEKEIGIELSKQILNNATNFIWKVFQQNDPADRKTLEKVTLFIDNSDGLAYAFVDEIHVNAKYFEDFKGDLKTDFTGLLHHETTHLWQWNGEGKTPVGLIEGIAHFVMYSAGYGRDPSLKPGDGERWDEGYAITALFLEYCTSLKNGIVAQLNKKMRYNYSEEYFVDLLGKPVQQLWKDYKDKYNNQSVAL